MPSLVVIALANVLLILGVAAFAGVRINTTQSLPVGLYRHVAGEPRRGDLVEACLPAAAAALATARGYLLPHGACGNHVPVIKRVAALAGDVVRLRKHVVVNERTLGTAPVLAADTAGRPLTRAPDRTLGADELWLMSDDVPHSFDSRYFGPVSRTAIRSVVRPLWTL